jgi:hypothetical protein
MKTMTPKEKAKEFMHYYLKELLSAKYRINGFVIKDLAKQCALIAVEEILSARPLDPNHVDWDDCGATHQYWYEAQKDEALEFWNNVKSELQSL